MSKNRTPGNNKRLPRVSIITVTTQDREFFNQRIQKIIDAQDYPKIQHIMLFGEGSIGSKRNQAIKTTSAEIICHVDSDDWISPDYISRCVKQLESCDTTGVSKAFFTDLTRTWLYEYRGKQPYILGSGACYWRKVWEKNPYQDTSRGEDTKFCANAGIIKPLDYLEGFVAQIHNSNTESQKALHLMKRVDLPTPLLQALQSF